MLLPKQVSAQLQSFLSNAISIEGASKGSIQLYKEKTNTLEYIAQKGLPPEFIEHFRIVRPFDSSACGRAFGIGSPVVISDVRQDIGFAPNLRIADSAGFRAVKSVPLRKDDAVVGILTTHFEQPQWQWDLRLLGDLCQELANYLFHIRLAVVPNTFS